MTPNVPSVLAELAHLLVRNAAPGIPDGERATALTLSSLLLGIASEVWDGEADILVKENRSFWSILQMGAELVEPSLAADLRGLPPFGEDDFRLSHLREYNAQARGLITRLHGALEDDNRDEADTVYRTIWVLLVQSTERRKLSVSLV